MKVYLKSVLNEKVIGLSVLPLGELKITTFVLEFLKSPLSQAERFGIENFNLHQHLRYLKLEMCTILKTCRHQLQETNLIVIILLSPPRSTFSQQCTLSTFVDLCHEYSLIEGAITTYLLLICRLVDFLKPPCLTL